MHEINTKTTHKINTKTMHEINTKTVDKINTKTVEMILPAVSDSGTVTTGPQTKNKKIKN